MTSTAIFAGGCFWCMVEPFETQPGILNVVSGYTGGHVPNPTYEQVASHTTGHTEAVQITFDPEIISYRELVEIYWQQTDPTDAMGQFQDRGDSYRPVIYVNSEEQVDLTNQSSLPLRMPNRFIRRKKNTSNFIKRIRGDTKLKRLAGEVSLNKPIGNKKAQIKKS